MEALNTYENLTPNKITLELNGDVEVSVEGFIAPIAYTQRTYRVKWDELANLRVMEASNDKSL